MKDKTLCPKYSDIDLKIRTRLYALINRPDVVKEMENATKYNHTGVEGIPEELLIELFGDRVRGKREKMLVGAMVRDTLEGRGYRLHRQNVKVKIGTIFSRASKYKMHSLGTDKEKS